MYRFTSNEIETINKCPICNSPDSKEVFINVKDWSFNVIDGLWCYHKCRKCKGLYLKDRPKQEFIYKAYEDYYTHSSGNKPSFIYKLENEILCHWLGIDLDFRLNSKLSLFFKFLKPILLHRYPLERIINLPVGRVLDVGCGNGRTLEILKNMGWDVYGIEMDRKAIAAANKKGVFVKEGLYEVANDFDFKFDCAIVSHVIEHTYNPEDFIKTLLNCTKDKGLLFISYPNPNSIMIKLFQKYWRGLEAPRHIQIPSIQWIEDFSDQLNCSSKQSTSSITTFWGSFAILCSKFSSLGRVLGKLLQILPTFLIFKSSSDIVQIEIEKKG